MCNLDYNWLPCDYPFYRRYYIWGIDVVFGHEFHWRSGFTEGIIDSYVFLWNRIIAAQNL